MRSFDYLHTQMRKMRSHFINYNFYLKPDLCYFALCYWQRKRKLLLSTQAHYGPGNIEFEQKFKKFTDLARNCYFGVFGVTYDNSGVKIEKLKMADLICLRKLKNFDRFG